MKIDEFRKEFIDELRMDASLNHTDTEDVFIERSIEILQNCGEVQDLFPMYFWKRRPNKSIMQINAYGIDEADGSLILMVSDFQDSYEPENLGVTQLTQLYKRMTNFLDELYKGDLQSYCDDSDVVLDVAKEIRNLTGTTLFNSSILKYKFFIITNSALSNTVKDLRQEDYNDRPSELHVWTMERYYEVIEAENSEAIVLDVNEFNCAGIPTLKAEVGEDLDYDAYLSIVSGKFLADIYLRYGSRLLEGNIRAFLGIKKAVNSGIRNTIIKEPQKFFTYNNGIAATATAIKLDDKGQNIVEIENFQIINGGQTTASLASAVIRKDNESLAGIYVPMKLTVIKPVEDVDEKEEIYSQLVERIARYANKQTAVKDADFFSNSPFHITMEKLSRRCIAPPVNGSPFSTIWYYERSRGKYDQEQFKMSKAEREKFKQKYPKQQKITKDDLAKYMMVLDCHPDAVAYGSGKIMKPFAEKIESQYQTHKEIFNEQYYKKVVCAAILYKRTDAIVNKQPWYPKGGNKAQIVPYTIAKILTLVPSTKSIDFEMIWQKQDIYPSFVHQIEIVSKIAHEFLLDSHGIIVRDYARDAKTWEKFKNVKIELTDEFLKDLVSLEIVKEAEESARKDQKETNKVALEVEVVKLGVDYWKNLIMQAKSKGVLSKGDENILLAATHFEDSVPKFPTSAQAKQIMLVREKLDSMGLIV